MLRKLIRRHNPVNRKRTTPFLKARKSLSLEPLEPRVLLDVAGWWDELGYRSASGGGVTWDITDVPGESQLVISEDGDPVLIWTEGTLNEYVGTDIPFLATTQNNTLSSYRWTVTTGTSFLSGGIYARQYADDIGWWDLSPGSGDTDAINMVNGVMSNATEMTATSGPNGEIVVVWTAQAILTDTTGDTAPGDVEIYAKMWDGSDWIELNYTDEKGIIHYSARDGGISDDGSVLNSCADVAISNSGEIFISYTALHPNTDQYEIVVKKYGFNTVVQAEEGVSQVSTAAGLNWFEVVGVETGLFGEKSTSGVSNDLSRSTDSAIAIDPEGNPVVVWSSVTNESNREIFAKRWDGVDWVEIGSGSAQSQTATGLGGISNDVGLSLEPDIAISEAGDIVVTWVNWADWQHFEPPANKPNSAGGKAGIFVKTYDVSADEWVAYSSGSTTGAGLAKDLGWFFSPEITLQPDGTPYIVWQGYGELERFQIDRDRSFERSETADHTPGLNKIEDRESPIMAVYASRYHGGGFELMYDSSNTWSRYVDDKASSVGEVRQSASPATHICWMPAALVDGDGNFLIAYSWRDSQQDIYNTDNEIYVQQWDDALQIWKTYGRGSDSNGNDVFGGSNSTQTTQLALVDYDGKADTDYDVFLANGSQIYLYSRTTGQWYSDDTIPSGSLDLPNGYSPVFDLKGEPEVEYGVEGPVLLAYIDWWTGLPYVYRWNGSQQGGGQWTLVGGGAAGPAGTYRYWYSDVRDDLDGDGEGDDYVSISDTWSSSLTYATYGSISVQAGPNGQIMLAYEVFDEGGAGYTDNEIQVVTRLFNGTSWGDAVAVADDSDGRYHKTINGQSYNISPKGEVNQITYIADYTGYDFTDTEKITIEEVIWDEDIDRPGTFTRSPLTSEYVLEQWYFIRYPGEPEENRELEFEALATMDLIEQEYRPYDGVTGETPDPEEDEEGNVDNGWVFVFGVDENDDKGPDGEEGENPDNPDDWEIADFENDVTMVAQGDYPFYLTCEGGLTVQMSYKFELSGKVATGTFYLSVRMDGEVIEYNGGTEAAWTSDISTEYATVTLITDRTDWAAGEHTLSLRAGFKTEGLPEPGEDEEEGEEPNEGIVAFDNLAVYSSVYGDGDWELTDVGGMHGDTGGNRNVGPRNDAEVAFYDFNGDLHLSLGGGGGIGSIIVPVKQTQTGDLIVSFRYKLTEVTTFQIMADGKWYDELGDAYDTKTTITPAPSLLGRWWNENKSEPEYAYMQIVLSDVPMGTSSVEIVLEDIDSANLWVDNLSVLSSYRTNAVHPIVTLLPTGVDGERHFAVGMSNWCPSAKVYSTLDTNFVPDGYIASFGPDDSLFNGGYYSAAIFELDVNSSLWSQYGTNLELTTDADLLGFSFEKNFQRGVLADVEGLGNYLQAMPRNELYRLDDLTIGPNSLLWIGLQHATTEYVDISDPTDGENDRFDVHPWTYVQPERYWTLNATDLDIAVWRWSPLNDPMHVTGTLAQWVDTNLTPAGGAHAYTNIQLVGSSGQLPTAAWTERGSNTTTIDSCAQRYESIGAWGVLHTESVQNDEGWSALFLSDMIIRADGYPIVSFWMSHLVSDGLREFRSNSLVPSMTITENSDEEDDWILNFGTLKPQLGQYNTQTFLITNEEDSIGDLLVYRITFGGLGDLPASAFTLVGEPTSYPLILEPGESRSLGVKFDANGVPVGVYNVVLLVESNDPYHPTHPYSHYFEILLTVEVVSAAEIRITTDPASSTTPPSLVYPSTAVGTESDTKSIFILHDNDPTDVSLSALNLVVDSWGFYGVSYEIQSVSIYRKATGLTTSWISPLYNPATDPESEKYALVSNSSSDDIALLPGDYIQVQVVFAPAVTAAIGTYGDAFYISSSDSDESLSLVKLTGVAISASKMRLYEGATSGGEWTVTDGKIDFGNVIAQAGNSAVRYLRIVNEGESPLLIAKFEENYSTIEIYELTASNQQVRIENRQLTAKDDSSTDDEMTVVIIWSPDPVSDTATAPIPLGVNGEGIQVYLVSDTPDVLLQNYAFTLTGQAVPLNPLIEIMEVTTALDGEDDLWMEFGSVNPNQIAGGTGPQRSFWITNIGGTNLILSDIWVKDSNPVFEISSMDKELSFNESVLVTVTFQPEVGESGMFQQVLRIDSNAKNEPTAQVVLVGTSVDPELVITDSQGSSGDLLVNFGSLGEGLSRSYTITLTNTGGTELRITNWVFTGNTEIFDVPDFSSAATDGVLVLQPNQSRILPVSFYATDIGNYSGVLSFTSDSYPAAGPVTLQGTVIAAGSVSVLDGADGASISGLDFTPDAPITVGQSVQKQFYLANAGGSNLYVTSMLVTTEAATPFRLDVRNLKNNLADDNVLPPEIPNNGVSEGLLVTVTFSPTMEFYATHELEIITTSNMAAFNLSDPSTYVTTIVTLSGHAVAGIPDTTPPAKQEYVVNGGHLVTIKLAGPGSFTVVQSGESGTAIDSIILSGTNEKSTLTVSSKVAGGEVKQIVGGTMKGVTMKNVALSGSGISLNAAAGALKLDDLLNGADVEVATVLSSKVSIQADYVGSDSVLHLGGSMKSVKLTGGEFDGVIWVEGSLGSLSATKAQFGGAVRAEMINKVSLKEADGASFSVRSLLNNFSVKGNFTDSVVSAGYDLGSDGRVGGTGTAADVLYSGGWLGKVKVGGVLINSTFAAGIKCDASGDFFNPIATMGADINKVQIKSVQYSNNNVKFGVVSDSMIAQVKVGGQTLPVSYTNDDFEVQIL